MAHTQERNRRMKPIASAVSSTGPLRCLCLLVVVQFCSLLHTATAENLTLDLSAFKCAGLPEPVAHAEEWPPSCNNTWTGSTCEAACLPGYVGAPTAVCEGSTWGAVNGTCDLRTTSALVASRSSAAAAATASGVASGVALATPTAVAATSTWTGVYYYPYGTCHKDANCVDYPTAANLTNSVFSYWSAQSCNWLQDSSSCAISCRAGYVGGYRAQCKQSQWGTWGTCVRDASCRGLPSSANVTNTYYTWEQVMSNLNNDATQVFLYCNYPYVGSYIAQCKQGNYTVYGHCLLSVASSRTCSATSLPAPSRSPNAAAAWSCSSGSIYYSGDMCELPCKDGFVGGYYTWCNVTSTRATWTLPIVGSCLPATSCDWLPPDRANLSAPNSAGDWSCTPGYQQGSVCSTYCAEGFVGQYWTICTAGRWSPPFGSCWRESTCTQPQSNTSFANATGIWDCSYYYGDTILDGTRCSMACNSGMQGGYYTWCKSGQWTAPAGTCYPDANMCPEPPSISPANATGVWSCWQSAPYYTNGMDCNMPCNDGYVGGYYTWCKWGQWLPVQGGCRKDTGTCPELYNEPALRNAPWNGDGSWYCESFNTGALCTMSCRIPTTGTAFQGSLFKWCQDGAWSAPSGYCRQFTTASPARSCTLPQNLAGDAPANGAYAGWADVCDGTLYDGRYCQMMCAPGYIGKYIVQCQRGNVSSVMGSCRRDTRCSVVPDSTGLQNSAYANWATVYQWQCGYATDGRVCAMGCKPRHVGGYLVQCNQGNWSTVMGSCHKDTRCYGYPQSDAVGLQNAQYDDWAATCYSSTSDGGVCEMQCSGDWYQGSYLAMCKEGTWLGVPGCAGSPPNPTDGRYACGLSSPQGTVCTANCSSGYTGSPIPTATCLSNGTWGVSGRCIQIVCNNSPRNPANGTFNCGSRSLPGTVCRANCSAGFTGSPSSRCQADGRWSTVSGVCTQIVCSNSPPNPANGTFSCGARTLPGGTCTANCNMGFIGPANATCLANGTWSAVSGACTPVCLGSPANPANGAFNCGVRTLPGGTCTASCIANSTVAPNATCLANGTWSAVAGLCPPVCVGSPANPANGTFSCGASSLPGSVCSGNCSSDFTGRPNATCLSNGTWGPMQGNCSRIVCVGSPANPANGTFNCGASSLPGAVCGAGCSSGFVGSPTATCLANGTWGAVQGNCSRIVCNGNPVNPSNGTFSCPPSSLPGAVCAAGCSSGFTGRPNSTCLSNGTWAPAQGNCSRIVCLGSPLNPANGTFSCGASTLPGGTCSANCSAGFTGAPNATCLANGTWSAVSGVCTRVCVGLPAIPVGGTYYCAATTPVNGVCGGNCSVAYNGTLTATCRANGTWTTTGTCRLAACVGNPANITGGAFDCGTRTLLLATCSGSCTIGFTGRPNVTCLSNGTWSTVRGNCTTAAALPGHRRQLLSDGGLP